MGRVRLCTSGLTAAVALNPGEPVQAVRNRATGLGRNPGSSAQHIVLIGQGVVVGIGASFTGLGGGFLIAVIAIIHVYVAQFAVGGGLFLVLTEHLGRSRNDQGIIDFVKKHTKFFLLLTMVFGALTGVGIWFTISLLSPSATSVLIHTFLFGWGTEWVFFVTEIVSLFIYYYTFDRLSKRNHLIIGWIYFGAAWMSLFVINGIIAFMLTPGAWIENHNFWSGFFNPTF